MLYDKVSYTDPSTHRLILFTNSASLHHCARHSSSFIHLPSGYLGQITSLFAHKFVSEPTEFARVQVFKNPLKDSESNLYYVPNVQKDPHSNIYHSTDAVQMIIPVKELSTPHVVAHEDQKLWFISFKNDVSP